MWGDVGRCVDLPDAEGREERGGVLKYPLVEPAADAPPVEKGRVEDEAREGAVAIRHDVIEDHRRTRRVAVTEHLRMSCNGRGKCVCHVTHVDRVPCNGH